MTGGASVIAPARAAWRSAVRSTGSAKGSSSAPGAAPVSGVGASVLAGEARSARLTELSEIPTRSAIASIDSPAERSDAISAYMAPVSFDGPFGPRRRTTSASTPPAAYNALSNARACSRRRRTPPRPDAVWPLWCSPAAPQPTDARPDLRQPSSTPPSPTETPSRRRWHPPRTRRRRRPAVTPWSQRKWHHLQCACPHRHGPDLPRSPLSYAVTIADFGQPVADSPWSAERPWPYVRRSGIRGPPVPVRRHRRQPGLARRRLLRRRAGALVP